MIIKKRINLIKIKRKKNQLNNLLKIVIIKEENKYFFV